MKHTSKYFVTNCVFYIVRFLQKFPGFLSTDDTVANGNAGLKDQVMALTWVQENVRKFGGDPKRVTLFGQGSGAISVHLLMMSPMARGLFKKAICESGTALTYNSIQTRPLEAAQRLARKLKCAAVLNSKENATVTDVKLEDVLGNTTLLVECLKTVKAKKIAEIHEEAFVKFSKFKKIIFPIPKSNGYLSGGCPYTIYL